MSEAKIDRAPRDHKISKNVEKKGLIIVNTGEGKGKTTAAFGTAMRAVGHGFKVAMVQFIKGKWKTGEVEAAHRYLEGLLKVYPMGQGFTWETKNFEQDRRSAELAWKKCQEILFDQEHQLVIFDEINYVLQYNFLDCDEVLAALAKKPPLKHVILTGGGAPEKLIDAADLVTEMKCIKHPYEQGILAQIGIEF